MLDLTEIVKLLDCKITQKAYKCDCKSEEGYMDGVLKAVHQDSILFLQEKSPHLQDRG